MFTNGKKIASIETKVNLLLTVLKSVNDDQKKFHQDYHRDKDIINARINRRVKTKNAIIAITILISVLGLLIKAGPMAAKLFE